MCIILWLTAVIIIGNNTHNVKSLLNWTSRISYRVDLSWCAYHLSTLGGLPGSSSSTLSTSLFVPNPYFHQYCRGRSLPMICSFITTIFNNHPYLFVKLVYFLFIPPYMAPEKWAYHPPSPSAPSSPRKIAFQPFPHFRPLSYIPHEKWGYHRRWTSTQNFPGKIGFWRGGRVFYRTIIVIGWMITIPPFYSWKLNWRFRIDIPQWF